MDEYTACEQAYKNGYEQGKKDAVKHGEWKKGKDFPSCPRVKFISDAYYCSVCENEAFYDTDYGQQLFNFCPNCGADMRGDTQ